MRRFITLILAVLASGFLWHTACGQEAPGSMTMDMRSVPSPAGVSKEFRELIATRQIPPAAPVPQTREEWLELQRTLDANNAKTASALATKLGATWESLEVGGVPCFLVTPKKIGDRFKDRWLVHIHGGAFVLNGGEGCVSEALWVADAVRARVLSIDYHRPPPHQLPGSGEPGYGAHHSRQLYEEIVSARSR